MAKEKAKMAKVERIMLAKVRVTVGKVARMAKLEERMAIIRAIPVRQVHGKAQAKTTQRAVERLHQKEPKETKHATSVAALTILPELALTDGCRLGQCSVSSSSSSPPNTCNQELQRHFLAVVQEASSLSASQVVSSRPQKRCMNRTGFWACLMSPRKRRRSKMLQSLEP